MNNDLSFYRPDVDLIKDDIKESVSFILGISNSKIKSYPIENKIIKEIFIKLLDESKLSTSNLINELNEKISNEHIEYAISLYNCLLFKASRLVLSYTQQELSNVLDFTIRQITNIETLKRPLQKQTKMAIELLIIKNSKSYYLNRIGFAKECFD